jgi:hypothetical protein
MWLPIIDLIIKGILFIAGAIGVTRAFTGQPLVYAAGNAGGSGGNATTPASPDMVTSLPPAQAAQKAQQANAQNWAANPWLWAAVGVGAFGLTFLVRQTRGLGRDIGSAARTTRGALKEDLDELKGDPD